MNEMYQQPPQNQNVASSGLSSSFFSKTFGWMFVGLLLTAVTSILVSSSMTLLYLIYSNPFVFYGLIISEFVLVLFLSSRAGSTNFMASFIGFIVYAIINGATLSYIFIIYDIGLIFGAFISAALMFGVFALYGSVTKKDLSSLGGLFLMALIGLIIASIFNIFFASSTLDWILSYAGIAIFVGLTAYDVQRIKKISQQGIMNDSLAIRFALEIYLDFINIFLRLLRIFSKRR